MAENTDSTRRWVLDTNVVLDWLVFRDPGVRALVKAIEDRRVLLLCRADTRAEFLRVLDYPQVRKHSEARALAAAIYDRWHQMFEGAASALPLPVCRDPDDQKFLELARDAGAHWLISKDRALLELRHRVARSASFTVLAPEEARAALYNPTL